MWKCGNMSSMSLSNNSGRKCGNVEICLPCLCLIILEVWKCGNVEMWKCGNMSSLSLPNNSGSKEMWKCGNMSSMSLSNNSEVWKC